MEFIEKAWPFAESRNEIFTQKVAADKNRLHLFGLIARRKCLSQRQLSLFTGLHPSTVSTIVRALREQGLIREGAAIEAERVGPKEVELELIPSSIWCAGVTLFPRGHRLVLVNACGHVIAMEALPPGLATPDIVPCIVDRVQTCARNLGLDPARFGGLGVSVPGVVDSESGTVLFSRPLNLDRFPLRAQLAKAFSCPIWVERNVECGAYAEHHVGVARDQNSFIYFLLRNDPNFPASFGLSIVIGERIFHGCNSAAGEVDKNLRAATTNLLDATNGHILDADVDAFYDAFAHTLTGIVNLLDVGCVVLSGNDDRLTDKRFNGLRETIGANLLPVPGRRFSLLRSGMGIDGMMLGAALLALHRGLAIQLSQPPKTAKSNGKRLSKALLETASPM